MYSKQNKCKTSIEKMNGGQMPSAEILHENCRMEHFCLYRKLATQIQYCKNLWYQMRKRASPGFQAKAKNIKHKNKPVTTSETTEVLHSISINKSQQV
jgi:hypothetical protein